MNKTFKILLLIIAISISIGGIMFYYKTIVSPPKNLEFTNKHIENIAKSSNLFSSLKTDYSRDSLFLKIKDKVELCVKEGFISSNERDELMEMSINKYLPLFLLSCETKFNESIWYEKDHRWIEKKVREIKSLKIQDNTELLVQGEYVDSLDKIISVLKDYNIAKRISHLTSYKSLAEVRSVLSEAKCYSDKPYLKNCQALVNDLNELPSKIEKNHYIYLRSEVNRLKLYRKYDEISFKELSQEISRKLREYKVNASSVYGFSSNIKGLEATAAGYYDVAIAYYESLIKPEINIDYYPQWITMASPHYAYRAFQSNSNHYVGNSTSTMSFTIKGYDSFSFEVRSDGEPNYDFVMVGIDQIPTPNNNYFSTKGRPNSGVSYTSYRTIMLDNLSKYQTYRIYIVYRKDSSVNQGTDRGYVLIPYVQN